MDFSEDELEAMGSMSKYIASVVRNAMEDFHCENLSDDQMKTLNPIIRNAIFTALYAANLCSQSEAASSFVGFHKRCIPRYWEEPQLLRDYLETEEFFTEKREKGIDHILARYKGNNGSKDSEGS